MSSFSMGNYIGDLPGCIEKAIERFYSLYSFHFI